MKSAIKDMKNYSEKDYVELHTLYTFLCSNIILSFITLLLVKKADSIWMIIALTSNLIISLGFILIIRILGISNRLKYAIAIFYFFFMFIGMWCALTFAHQIVLFYALFIVLVTTLIFDGKNRTVFLICEISIYISLGLVDLYLRTHKMYIQPVEPRWLLGLLFIITSIIILVYIHNLALERSIEKLKTRAQTDSLTHVGNREALYQTIKSLEYE